MGALCASPYNRTVLWWDPRQEGGGQSVSRQLYEEWKSGRVRNAAEVQFGDTCTANVYALMEHYRGNDDGLSFAAFSQCMQTLKVHESHHLLLFRKFDKDGNGNVNPMEFCEAINGYVNGKHNLMLLQSVFSLFDVSNSGKLTVDELETLNHQKMKAGANADDTLPTRDQISVMMDVLRAQSANSSTCGGRILPFQVFVRSCSLNPSEVLQPFLNHILAVMCHEISRETD